MVRGSLIGGPGWPMGEPGSPITLTRHPNGHKIMSPIAPIKRVGGRLGAGETDGLCRLGRS